MLLHLPYWAAFIPTLLIAMLLGAVMERLLIRPLLHAPELTVVVASLSIGLMIKNGLRVSWQETVSTPATPFSDTYFRLHDISINLAYALVTSCALVIMGPRALFFRNNLLGKAMRALTAKPRVLMLDEPVPGTNQTEALHAIIACRRIARELNVPLLIIKHKMQMIMALTEAIFVPDHGAKIAEGTPVEVQSNPAVIEAYLGQEATAHA